MVKQVKHRSSFLSFSEFMNRRLDASDKDLSLKDALDDPDVPINENFRTASRETDAETAGVVDAVTGKSLFAFPEVAKGLIAYGDSLNFVTKMGYLPRIIRVLRDYVMFLLNFPA